MRLSEISAFSLKNTTPYNRSISAKRGAVTNRLYQFEKKNLETIKELKKQRPLPELQAIATKLWNKYSGIKHRKMPALRFGPGTSDLGYPLSFTYGYEYIELAPGERNLLVLCHELAHAFGPYQHGIRFVQRYWSLLKDFLPTQELRDFIKDELLNKHPQFVKKVYKR